MKKSITHIVSLFSIILLCACEHKELCELHPHIKTVRVEFDWQDVPEANPDGMCVFFYPIDGSKPERFDFSGKSGGEINILVGEYKVICYNNDTEAVSFRNTEQFDKHEAFTREGNLFESVTGNASQHTPRTQGTEEQAVVISPDMMWGCIAEEVTVTDTGVRYVCSSESNSIVKESDEHVIVLYPHEQVCTYTYEVRNIKYLNHVEQVCGSISGMAGSMFLATEDLAEKSVTIPFESLSDRVSAITGKFYTFGHNMTNDQPHHMTFYVWMDDGKKYAYGIDAGEKYNVTEQVNNAPDRRHVHIIIDGLDLPQPMEDGSGFDISVDGWEIIEEEIVL